MERRLLLVLFVMPLIFGAPDVSDALDSNSTLSDVTNLHAHVHEKAENNVSSVFNVTDELVTPEESLFFVKKLFSKFGGDETELTKPQLEGMLKSLGLVAMSVEASSHGVDHETHDSHSHDSHSHDEKALDRERKDVENSHIHSSHDSCLKFPDLLKAFHFEDLNHFSDEDFTHLCPAVIQQLTIKECTSDQSQNPQSEHKDGDSHVHADESFDLSKIPAKVWGYSTIAVLIISLVGLLGVAVIPIMQKVFYNHLLQFLVALAIGALSGDALLHLLPHAIVGTLGHSHDDSPEAVERDEAIHRATAWKGLMALAGILFFFVTERLLTILTAMKHRKKSKKLQKKKHCVKYCDVESKKNERVAGKLSGRQDSEDTCGKMVMLVHPNKDEQWQIEKDEEALKSFADATHDEFLHQCDEEQSIMGADKKSPLGDEPDLELMGEQYNGSAVEGHGNFGHSHGGHGHGHGHLPNSAASVAWMVILGDGIHNFSDGLAIGASFANSITGGFSTSIAVFCHELPHEIGDFAVLLRAGMSPKQAALYNCLSSFLCFVGMVIGVSIGNISSASLWIFAVVGGMFLYIALVDMLPEMATVDPKKGENPFLHLLLQVVGIVLGSSIMLLIAVFEHDIKRSFS